MAVIILSELDNHRLVETAVGDQIVVRLPENPTTGFRWQLEWAEGAVQSEDDSFELGPSPQIGSGGVREFRFRVRGAQPGRIELKQWQAWEGEASVTQRYAVEILARQ